MVVLLDEKMPYVDTESGIMNYISRQKSLFTCHH